MSLTIKNIKTVEFCPVADIQYVSPFFEKKKIIAPWVAIDTVGLSEMTVETTIINGRKQHQVELQFISNDPVMDCLPENTIYRVTDITGRTYLIGEDLPPYPRLKENESFPGSVSKASANNYVVSLLTHRSMIKSV